MYILAHLIYLNPAPRAGQKSYVYFMGDVPQDGKPISLNGNIFVVCGILKFISASAAEAELGAWQENQDNTLGFSGNGASTAPNTRTL